MPKPNQVFFLNLTKDTETERSINLLKINNGEIQNHIHLTKQINYSWCLNLTKWLRLVVVLFSETQPNRLKVTETIAN